MMDEERIKLEDIHIKGLTVKTAVWMVSIVIAL